MSEGIGIITTMNETAKTPEQIINYLTADISELIQVREEQFSENDLDGYYDYLSGVIDRSQTILRMFGIPEEQIPNDGSC